MHLSAFLPTRYFYSHITALGRYSRYTRGGEAGPVSSVSRWLAPRLASPLTLVRSSKRRRKKWIEGGGEKREGKSTQVVLSRTCLATRSPRIYGLPGMEKTFFRKHGTRSTNVVFLYK